MTNNIKQTNLSCSMLTIGLVAIVLVFVCFIITLAAGMSTDPSSTTDIQRSLASIFVLLGYIGMIVFLVIGIVGIVGGTATGLRAIFRQITGRTREINPENSAVTPSTPDEIQATSEQESKIHRARIIQAGFIGLAVGILSICPVISATTELGNYLTKLYNVPANFNEFLYPVIFEPIFGLIGGIMGSLVVQMKRPKASALGGLIGGLLFAVIGLALIPRLIYLGYAR